MDMRRLHFEGPTWHDTKPGWYELELNLNGQPKRYREIIEWLYNTIEKCERHCRWFETTNGIKIKFRYERDYILAVLRWK
jgi:hypothetical protein